MSRIYKLNDGSEYEFSAGTGYIRPVVRSEYVEQLLPKCTDPFVRWVVLCDLLRSGGVFAAPLTGKTQAASGLSARGYHVLDTDDVLWHVYPEWFKEAIWRKPAEEREVSTFYAHGIAGCRAALFRMSAIWTEMPLFSNLYSPEFFNAFVATVGLKLFCEGKSRKDAAERIPHILTASGVAPAFSRSNGAAPRVRYMRGSAAVSAFLSNRRHPGVGSSVDKADFELWLYNYWQKRDYNTFTVIFEAPAHPDWLSDNGWSLACPGLTGHPTFIRGIAPTSTSVMQWPRYAVYYMMRKDLNSITLRCRLPAECDRWRNQREWYEFSSSVDYHRYLWESHRESLLFLSNMLVATDPPQSQLKALTRSANCAEGKEFVSAEDEFRSLQDQWGSDYWRTTLNFLQSKPRTSS